ncbi:hypothetical protein FQA39_LY05025 [Lamprigera yunnana]|nr:hypothetical protein FQA39_LY05025 [Lamprigera yunnana]
MSLEVVNLKRKKPNEQFCLFCDNSSDLVKNPRPGTLLHIKEAANRRKDSISEKFSKLYDPDCTKQEFSWHQDCLATYISEEKIRRREIALYKEEEEVSVSTSKANVEELTPKSRSSSRTPTALKKSLKCIFCKKKAKEEETAHGETKEHAIDSESGESVIDSRAPESVINVETEVELDNAETTQTETKTAEETLNPEAETHNADAEVPQPAGDAKVEVHNSKVKEQTSNSKAAALGKADDISSTDATRELDVEIVSTSKMESADTPSSPKTELNVDLNPTDATVELEPTTIEELDKQDPKSQHQVPPSVLDDLQPTKCDPLPHGQSHMNGGPVDFTDQRTPIRKRARSESSNYSRRHSKFGDARNETLLENDLTICYQLSNQTYDEYYEVIKSKLQQLLEHLTIKEANLELKVFKIDLYNSKALETFKAGLLEPHRSFISYQTVTSLEDCILQLRNYDNHKQQVNFLNFIRQKPRNKNFVRNINTHNKPQFQKLTQPNHSFNNPNRFNFPNFNHNFYKTNQFNSNPNYKNTHNNFPTFPNATNTSSDGNRYPRNQYNFNHRKPEYKPTPMSISTRNTNRSRGTPNHFQATGP